jgi:protein farnesyltransferase subunit beta
MSHLAGTYAAVLSLASVGGGALSLVNRISMLKWLHSIKNPDGSFKVCIGGETDVRGIYCALTAISILRLPTDNGLLKNTTEYLVSCQTYEGGFAATPGGNEAHGGYTFCALAALAILYPPEKLKELIDMDALLRWMSARQYGPEGGLSGRTNKLVDGCYSTWIGGCWPLIEAALGCETGSLWNREGLVRYIMAATQNDKGGLRDKPSKNSDFYHTNYVLLGLSGTQHRHWYEAEEETKEWEEGLPLMAVFGWKAEETTPGVTGWETWPDSRWGDSKTDRVEAAHPVFNIKHEMVEETRKWAENFL